MNELQHKRILIVDDEGFIRDMLREEFEALGAGIDEAVNGVQAAAMAQQVDYDAIISDVRMPGGDGLTLAREIYKLGRLLPKVFLCSGFGAEDSQELQALGIVATFHKPFNLQEMTTAVCTALAPTAAAPPAPAAPTV